MNKVIFIQDIGVERSEVEMMLQDINLVADWNVVDGKEVLQLETVIAVVTVNQTVDSMFLLQFPNLKIVSVSFTGYDHVDKQYCTDNNIAVFNVPSYSTNSVVELAVGLAISLLREIPRGDQLVRTGEWNASMLGSELSGKTCGIIGIGAIGLRLTEVLKVLNCNIIGWSRSKKDDFEKLGGEYVEYEELFEKSDLVFPTVALNEKTKGIISEKEISLMKSTSFIVNVARGPIIERSALIKGIQTRKIAGAGLDVFDVEPLPLDDYFRSLENTIMTPHVAYKTAEALKRKAVITIHNIENGLKNSEENRVV